MARNAPKYATIETPKLNKILGEGTAPSPDPFHRLLLILLLYVVLVGATVLKNQGSVVSNRIGMTFGRIVLRVNRHRLTESHFCRTFKMEVMNE